MPMATGSRPVLYYASSQILTDENFSLASHSTIDIASEKTNE